MFESVFVSLAAGGLALPVAHWKLETMKRFVPPSIHGATDIALDARTLIGLSACSVLTAALVALLPGLSEPRQASSYNRGVFATVEPFQRRIRNALVITEVVMALVLLSIAASLVTTLTELMRIDLGARDDDALVVELTLPHASYESDDSVMISGSPSRLIHPAARLT